MVLASKPRAKLATVSTKQQKFSTKWLSNALKSTGILANDVIKDISPNVYEVASSGINASRTLVTAMRKNKTGTDRIANTLRNNKYVQYAHKAYSNAIEDIKTGNFYNSDRMYDTEEESTAEHVGDVMEGFSFGDDGADESPNVNVNIDNSDSGAMLQISNQMKKQSESQLKVQKASMDAFIAVNSAQMQQMSQANAEIINHLSNINNNLAAIVQYNNENMNRFIEASITYYDRAGATLSSPTDDKVKVTLEDVLNSSMGGLNVNRYKALVKDQLKEYIETSDLGMIKSFLDDDVLKMISANAMSYAIKEVATRLIPSAIKTSLQAVETTFSNFVPTMLAKVGELADSDDYGMLGNVKRAIGKIFGLKADVSKETFEDVKIERGAIPFDGETKHAVTEIITKELRDQTGYLRIIAKHFDNDAETKVKTSGEYWSYKSNSYVNKEELNNQLADEIIGSVSAAFSSTRFGKSLDRLVDDAGKDKDGNYIENDEERKKKEDAVRFSIDEVLMKIVNSKKQHINLESLLEIVNSTNLTDTTKQTIANYITDMATNDTDSFQNINVARMKAVQKAKGTVKDIKEDAIGYNLFNTDFSGKKDIVNEVAKYRFNENAEREDLKSDTTVENTSPQLNLSSFIGRGANTAVTMMQSIMNGDTMGVLSKGASFIGDTISKIGDKLKDSLFGGKSIGDYVNEAGEKIKTFFLGTQNENGDRAGGLFSDISNSLKDSLKSFKYTLTGKGYTDSQGNTYQDSENSIFAKFKAMGNDLKDGLMLKLFGKKKNEETGNYEKEGKGIVDHVVDTFKDGLLEWKKIFFGDGDDAKDPEETKQKIIQSIKDGMPNAVSGAAIGVGVNMLAGSSVLGMMMGGPLGSAALGAAAGFLSKNEKFQNWLFGEKDENGERTGGLISKKTQDFFKKNKDTLLGSGTLGAIGGAFAGSKLGILSSLVGGPIAGSLIGMAGSMALKSKTFQEFLFGDEENGKRGLKQILSDAFNRNFKKSGGSKEEGKRLLGLATVGTTAGGLIGMLMGGPLIGAFTGLVASIHGSGGDFKKWLFGENEGLDLGNGKKAKKQGVIGQFGNYLNANILKPMASKFRFFMEDFANTVKGKVLLPFSVVAEVAAGWAGTVLGKITNSVQSTFKGLVSSAKNLIESSLGPITKGIGTIAEKTSDLVFGAINRVIAAPGNLILAIYKTFDIGKKIRNFFKPVTDLFVDIRKATFKLIGGAAKLVFKGIKGLFKTALNVITSPFRLIGKLGKMFLNSELGVRVKHGLGQVKDKIMENEGVRAVVDKYKEYRDSDPIMKRINEGKEEYKARKEQIKADKKEQKRHDDNAKFIAKYTKGQFSQDTDEARAYLYSINKSAYEEFIKKAGESTTQELNGRGTVGMSDHELDTADPSRLSEEGHQTYLLNKLYLGLDKIISVMTGEKASDREARLNDQEEKKAEKEKEQEQLNERYKDSVEGHGEVDENGEEVKTVLTDSEQRRLDNRLFGRTRQNIYKFLHKLGLTKFLPHFAEGGETDGGPVVVGDGGKPEIIVPPAGSKVIDGDSSDAILSNASEEASDEERTERLRESRIKAANSEDKKVVKENQQRASIETANVRADMSSDSKKKAFDQAKTAEELKKEKEEEKAREEQKKYQNAMLFATRSNGEEVKKFASDWGGIFSKKKGILTIALLAGAMFLKDKLPGVFKLIGSTASAVGNLATKLIDVAIPLITDTLIPLIDRAANGLSDIIDFLNKKPKDPSDPTSQDDNNNSEKGRRDAATVGMNTVTSLFDAQVNDTMDWVNPLKTIKHNKTDAAGNTITNSAVTKARDQALWRGNLISQITTGKSLPQRYNSYMREKYFKKAEKLEARANAQSSKGGALNNKLSELNRKKSDAALEKAEMYDEQANAPQNSTGGVIVRNVARVGALTALSSGAGGLASAGAKALGLEDSEAQLAGNVATSVTAAGLTANMGISAVKGKTSIIDKVLDGLEKVFKFIAEKVGADKAIQKVGNSKVVKSITDLGSKICKGIKGKFTDVVIKKIQAAFAKWGVQVGATTITAGLAILGGALAGAASGFCGTEHLFGVLPGEADAGMKTISTLLGTAFGALEWSPLGWIVCIFDIIDGLIMSLPMFKCGIKQAIARAIYGFFGDSTKLEEKQNAFNAEMDYYNNTYGTSLDDKTFNDMVNNTGFISRIWSGKAGVGEDGHLSYDEAGALLKKGGIKNAFVGNDKEYTKDANGNVVRRSDGSAVVARDAYGDELKKNSKFGDYFGIGFNQLKRQFVGGNVYKTDENGRALVDENGNYIIDHKEKNIFQKMWDGDSLLPEGVQQGLKAKGLEKYTKGGTGLKDFTSKAAKVGKTIGAVADLTNPFTFKKGFEWLANKDPKTGWRDTTDGTFYDSKGQHYSTAGDKMDTITVEELDAKIASGVLVEDQMVVKDVTLSETWNNIKTKTAEASKLAIDNAKTWLKEKTDKFLKENKQGISTFVSFCNFMDDHKERRWYAVDGTYFKLNVDTFTQYNAAGDPIAEDISKERFETLVTSGFVTSADGEIVDVKAGWKTDVVNFGVKAKNAFKDFGKNISDGFNSFVDKSKAKIDSLFKTINKDGVEGYISTKLGIKKKTKVWYDTNGCYYKLNASGKYSYHNANGDIIKAEGEVDTDKVLDLQKAGLLTEGELQENSEAKKAVNEIQKAVSKAWSTAKDTVKNGWNQFTQWLTGSSNTSNPTNLSEGGSGKGFNNAMKKFVAGGKGEESSNPYAAMLEDNEINRVNTYFAQTDPRWANMSYNTGQDNATMADTGCGPTAMAMVASDVTGKLIDPMQLANLAKVTGGRDETGTNWKFVDESALMLGMKSNQVLSPSAADIRNQIANGSPVLLSGTGDGTNNPYTPAGHYVVANGIDENGNVMIKDPRGAQYNKSYDINSIASTTGSSWSFEGPNRIANVKRSDGELEEMTTLLNQVNKDLPTVKGTTTVDTSSINVKERTAYIPGTNIMYGVDKNGNKIADLKKNQRVIPGTNIVYEVDDFGTKITTKKNERTIPGTNITYDVDKKGNKVADKSLTGRVKWIRIIRAVKKAIADQKPGYSQSNWINITVDGRELKVRTDCSGFVAACLKYLGVLDESTNLYTGIMGPNSSVMASTGFTSSAFEGWDTLKEGDILVKNGHTEIFAYNEGNAHYVYNCGSNSSVNNPNATRASNGSYTNVWSPNFESESASIPSTNLNYNSDGTLAEQQNTTGNVDSTASVDTSGTTKKNTGGVFSKLTSYLGSFFTEFGSRAITGDFNNTDYSDILNDTLGISDEEDEYNGVTNNTNSESSDATIDSSSTHMYTIPGTNISYEVDKDGNRVNTESKTNGSNSSEIKTHMYTIPGTNISYEVDQYGNKVNPETIDPERRVWNYLIGKGLTPQATAGIMGNLMAESGIRSNNLQNSYEKRLGSDEEYTSKVDSGEYNNFIGDKAGYGLAQWTSAGRKEGLYNLAKSRGTSIADIGTQLDWLWEELNSPYYKGKTLDKIANTDDIQAASDTFLTKFECPANQDNGVMQKRGNLARDIYNRQCGGSGTGPKPKSSSKLSSRRRYKNIDTKKMTGGFGIGTGNTSTTVTNDFTWKHMSDTNPNVKKFINTTNQSTISDLLVNAIEVLAEIAGNTGMTKDRLGILNTNLKESLTAINKTTNNISKTISSISTTGTDNSSGTTGKSQKGTSPSSGAVNSATGASAAKAIAQGGY